MDRAWMASGGMSFPRSGQIETEGQLDLIAAS